MKRKEKRYIRDNITRFNLDRMRMGNVSKDVASHVDRVEVPNGCSPETISSQITNSDQAFHK